MENNNLNYISKQDCVKRGLTKLQNGRIYKRNTIERYAHKGFLNGAEYNVDELLLAARDLYKDYYRGGIEKNSSNDPCKIKVDGHSDIEGSEETEYHYKRFIKAIETLPQTTQKIVTRVCCEDKDIIVTGTTKQKIYLAHQYLEILKLGLCRLAKHYTSIEQYKMDEQHCTIGER